MSILKIANPKWAWFLHKRSAKILKDHGEEAFETFKKIQSKYQHLPIRKGAGLANSEFNKLDFGKKSHLFKVMTAEQVQAGEHPKLQFPKPEPPKQQLFNPEDFTETWKRIK